MTISHQPAENHAWVHDVLEPGQLSLAKPRYGRRKLGRATLVLLWGLRVYVVLMLVLIGFQVWNALHAKS